jgi:hypothetical protein
VLIGIGYGFYVPGIAPREFAVGDLIGKDFWWCWRVFDDEQEFFIFPPGCFFFVEVKAVKLQSSRTQLPYDYYSLQFCLPKNGTLHYKSENLGEVLRGESTGSLCYLIINFILFFRWSNRQYTLRSANE